MSASITDCAANFPPGVAPGFSGSRIAVLTGEQRHDETGIANKHVRLLQSLLLRGARIVRGRFTAFLELGRR